MLTTFSIGIPAAALAVGGAYGLDSEWLYNPVHQPVMIEVAPPPSSEPLQLVLMDAEGNLHVDPFTAEPGTLDLADAVPEIWRLRRAAYLQMFLGSKPVGPSLVIQPLLSRLVPVTENAVNPNGIEYTRIVEWRDETKPTPPAAGAGRDASRPGGP